MSDTIYLYNRRLFLGTLACGVAAFTTRGLFAEELVRTPRQTEGPFYPNKLPLDTDNDLLVINETMTPAVGEVTHLGGRILDAKGNPVRNALVEIWQVDNNGSYIHTRDPKARDAITVAFAPLKGSKIGALAARFDLVLGLTPESD